MKKTKHSEEKIIGAVKQLEAGRPVKEVAREMGVTDQTLYNWKAKVQGDGSQRCERSWGRWRKRTGG